MLKTMKISGAHGQKAMPAKQDAERMDEIVAILSGIYPDVKIQLNFSNPFELLIATILSAQCTDARVNIVTGSLFEKYKSPEDFIGAPLEEIETDIYSTGFYKNKAKNIKAASAILLERFRGRVPGTMEELLQLPGVGRKTANVLLGHCFDTPGIVVDTHVIRIANKLGFVDTTDPVKIEFALMELVPKEKWVDFTHYMIHHGRETCIARRPKCLVCPIAVLCPSAESGG